MDCFYEIPDDPASAQQFCDQARALLQEAEKNVKADEVREGFDRLLNDHDRFAGVENDAITQPKGAFQAEQDTFVLLGKDLAQIDAALLAKTRVNEFLVVDPR